MSERMRQLEVRLREIVAQSEGGRLPSVQVLARLLHASPNTVSRVMRVLRDEGLVEFAPGTPARKPVSGVKRPEESVQRMPAYLRLATDVKQRIQRGEFSHGDSLPQAKYLATTRGVSADTVSKAYQTLVRERLAHKSGRGYAAGDGRRRNRPGHRPRLLLLQPQERTWQSLIRSSRTRRFALSFIGEADRVHVEVIPIFVRKPGGAGFLTWGEDGIRTLIESEPHRYIGTLITGRTDEYYWKHNEHLQEWIHWLCRFRRPVVWFDGMGLLEGPQGFRHGAIKPYLKTLSDPLVRRHHLRCFWNERGALDAAIRALADEGHLLAAFLNTRAAFASWVGQRYAVLLETLQGRLRMLPLGPGLESAQGDSATPESLIGRALRAGATAILAANDTVAREIYFRCREQGLRIPEDITLLSFDADPEELFPFPISSVDFGFGYLGYAAFHAILGDVKVPRKGNGIPSLCAINHPGTIGRPGI